MTELDDLVSGGRPTLEAALAGWMPRQRWFPGKARTVEAVSARDWVVLRAGADTVVDLLAEVSFDDGHVETYQVPLAPAADGASPGEVVVTLDGCSLVDATAAAGAAAALLHHSVDATQTPTRQGATVAGKPVATAATTAAAGAPRRLGAEQSNTSIVYGDELILKVFRRLEPGANPDVEVTRALTEAGFEAVPAQHGALELHAVDGDVTALAVLAAFVSGGKEGWDLATREVRRLTTVYDADPDPWLRDRLRALGTAVGDLHAALNAALGGREATADDRSRWVGEMREQVDRVLRTAAQRAPEACAEVLVQRDALHDRLSLLGSDTARTPLTRIHGDLHLGQVLLDAEGRWQLLDFEGEPSRPLAERRALQPPLKDVAGLLRSLDYAAAAGSGGALSEVPPAAAAWRDESRARFLDAYVESAGAQGVLPAAAASVAAQLDAFELDKAVYELGYELANRPDWVPLPIGGILRVLDRPVSA